MPTYEVFIDGKQKKIEITTNSPDTMSAKLDGKTAAVEIVKGKPGTEAEFVISIDGKPYNVNLAKVEFDKLFQVKVEDATFKAELKTRRQAAAAPEPTPKMAPVKRTAVNRQVVEGAVTAPMTGKVLSIKVKKGDRVKEGQAVCVIEAMKMENEISASKAGTVKEVKVAEGASVSEGDVLLVID